MTDKRKPRTKTPPAPTAGETTRTGRTASGGTYTLHVAVQGIEINGQPVPGQMVADALADRFEDAVRRAKRRTKRVKVR